MAGPGRPISGISQASIDALADDPDVQAAVKELALETIKWQVSIMKSGTAAMKAQLAKSYGPMLAKLVGEQGARSNDALRDEFRAVMARLAEAPPTPVKRTTAAPAVDRPR